MSETTGTLPRHVGFIVDGNRRWAQQQGLPTFEGHQRGFDILKDITQATFNRGVTYVSCYIFSVENWQRTQEEVSYLMKLATRLVEKNLKSFHEEGIKMVMLGSRQRLSKSVLAAVDRSVEQTKNNTKGTLALCFNYGGFDEIAQAAQATADAGKKITPEAISQHLYEPDIPPLDLVIRTSGEQRLSGFMLWRAAYSELYFSDMFWPDFTEAELDKALAEYSRRRRRFGK